MSASKDKDSKIGWSFSNMFKVFNGEDKSKPVVTYFQPLQNNLEKLEKLRQELHQMIEELERSLEK